MNRFHSRLAGRRLGRLVPALLMMIAASMSFADSFPRTVTDAREESVSLSARPDRIVSLSPSLTEILFAIGAGDSVVGVTTYCNYPVEAAEIEKIGGFSEKSISIETIIAFEPDVVFADMSRHESVIETLERYGVSVVSTNATSVADVYRVIELVGDATGTEARSRAVVADMRARVEAVTSMTDRLTVESRPRVFWEVFDEPLMTAGPSTFIGELIVLAGGTNIFGDVTESWPSISQETLLERDPEVLMSSDSHGEKFTPEQVAARPGWEELDAVRNGRIYLFDGDMVSRPGPRIADVLEHMFAALHPDLAE